MMINGSAIDAAAVNSYSQLIEYFGSSTSFNYGTATEMVLLAKVAGDASFGVSNLSETVLSTKVAGDASFDVSNVSNATLAALLAGDSSYIHRTDNPSLSLTTSLHGVSDYAYGTTGGNRLSTTVQGDSRYGMSTTMGSLLQVSLLGTTSSNYKVTSSIVPYSLTSLLNSELVYRYGSNSEPTLVCPLNGNSAYAVASASDLLAAVMVGLTPSNYKVTSSTVPYSLTSLLNSESAYRYDTQSESTLICPLNGSSSAYAVASASGLSMVAILRLIPSNYKVTSSTVPYSLTTALGGSLVYNYVTGADSVLTSLLSGGSTYDVLTSGSSKLTQILEQTTAEYAFGANTQQARLIAALAASSSFAYNNSGVVTPSSPVHSHSSYSYNTSGIAYEVSALGASTASFEVATSGRVAPLMKVPGSALKFSIGGSGTTRLAAKLGGDSSYSVSNSGSLILGTLLQAAAEYVINSVGNNKLDSSFSGAVSYRVTDRSRANVIKYSQEILEESAGVTYNVEMVGN